MLSHRTDDHDAPLWLETNEMHRDDAAAPLSRKASQPPRSLRPGLSLRDEAGFALAFAALLGGVVTILAALILVRGVAQSGSIDGERSWEQALQSAESGLHEGFVDYNDDLLNSTSNVPDISTDPTFGGLTEKAWVLQQAASITPHTTPEGESVFFTVSGASSVYAVGYTPDQAGARHERVIKSAYSVTPSSSTLDYALLAGGDVEFDDDDDEGFISITGTAGHIHANGDLEADDDDPPNPQVSGNASATGNISDIDVTGTTTTGAAAEVMPTISARAYFDQAEYVLCPDGWVHRGPANGGIGTTPCSNFADAISLGPYLGWDLDDDEWRHEGSAVTDGVYYAYQTDIRMKNEKASFPWNASLIAESENNQCDDDDQGGSIRIDPEDSVLRMDARAGNLLLLAEGELRLDEIEDSTVEFNGIIASLGRTRVEVEEGTLTINGALVANATCDDDDDGDGDEEAVEIEADDEGIFTINYDGGMELLAGSGSGGLTVAGQTEL